MKIRFLSGNGHKISEATDILSKMGIDIIPVKIELAELQTHDMELLVREKTLQAHNRLGHSVFVEHTGLFIDGMNGFPGGLTQVFWDTLGAERICELFGTGSDVGVIARTRIGYCDGRIIRQFEGEIRGSIASTPKGDPSFQWDCIFIPEGYNQTFAEMGDEKNRISMRRKALDSFASKLREDASA